jgi:DNA gyrase/topoisomerase IV subunit A
MLMKKIAYLLSLMMMFTAFSPALAYAKDGKDKDKVELTAEEKARLSEIENRVEEIKAMDFGDMSKAEKKEVKKELKELNKEAKQLARGVYISIGTIIVILLILLLVT